MTALEAMRAAQKWQREKPECSESTVGSVDEELIESQKAIIDQQLLILKN